MLHINIICVGKLKEKYLQDAITEYSKRLSRYAVINIIELPDMKIPTYASIAEENNIKKQEGNSIISKLPKDSYIISLDLNGKQYTSEDFSVKIDNLSNFNSNITFIIGGSLGLSSDVINCSNELICFSKMTFPHQLIRVFLLEQIYRAFKISRGETYHK